MKRFVTALLATLLAGPVLAQPNPQFNQTQTYGSFTPTGRALDLSATTATSRVALGSSAGVAWVCNTGATNTVYVKLGTVTVVAAVATDFPIPAGRCAALNSTGATHISGITATSTTTVQTILGTGSPGASLGVGGGSGGGGSGTVTSVSVATANGLAGTVTTATTTPAITLTTTVTGSVCSNGTALSACTTTGTGSTVLATSPTLVTPALGVATATSVAIGGATIGTNALAVTGTSLFTGNITQAGGIIQSTTVGNSLTGGVRVSAATSTFDTSMSYAGVGAFGTVSGGYYAFSSSSTSGTGTFDAIISRNAAGVIQFGTTAANASGAWLAAKGTLTGGTLADQANVLAISATQPASPTGAQVGVTVTITSAGSASQTNLGMYVNYVAGYTGGSRTVGIGADNFAAGTGAALTGTAGVIPINNSGLYGTATATTIGTNIGQMGVSGNGNINAGLLGISTTTKNSATNIGVVGTGLNGGTSPVQIGGFFSLNQTTVPTVSAALIADNGAQANPVILARVAGATRWQVEVNGLARDFGFTVATLPAAGSAGRRAYVTDQLTTCAGVGVALTGGGAVVCPAFDNGVAWVGGFMLKRDLAPASNDNTPAFMNMAA